MIYMSSIDWQPMSTMPADRRDGREVLLAVANTLGTANGGDGVMRDPKHPWLLYIAIWDGERWRMSESDGWDDSLYLAPEEAAYWADINYPESDQPAIQENQ